MKKIVPYIVMFLLLAAIYYHVDDANAETLQLYSEKGYPYKNLIGRTDSVEVIFTENENKVTCNVHIKKHSRHWRTENVVINKIDFDKTPLASCLPRKKAKSILAQTWAEDISIH